MNDYEGCSWCNPDTYVIECHLNCKCDCHYEGNDSSYSINNYLTDIEEYPEEVVNVD